MMPFIGGWKTGVYGIRNRVNGKIYVGSATKSLRNRLRQHRNGLTANRHTNKHLQAAWNRYGAGAFLFFILEKCHPDRCLDREQLWIDRFNSADPVFGYNRCPIAGNCRGVKHSEDTKRKASETAKKRNESQELRDRISKSVSEVWENDPTYRERISKAKTGKKASAETRARMSLTRTGKKHSLETRTRMRRAALEREMRKRLDKMTEQS